MPPCHKRAGHTDGVLEGTSSGSAGGWKTWLPTPHTQRPRPTPPHPALAAIHDSTHTRTHTIPPANLRTHTCCPPPVVLHCPPSPPLQRPQGPSGGLQDAGGAAARLHPPLLGALPAAARLGAVPRAHPHHQGVHAGGERGPGWGLCVRWVRFRVPGCGCLGVWGVAALPRARGPPAGHRSWSTAHVGHHPRNKGGVHVGERSGGCNRGGGAARPGGWGGRVPRSR